MNRLGLMILLVFLLFSFGCKDWSKSVRDKAEDVKQKARLKAPKEQRKMEFKLNELDRWIDELKVRAKESEAEAKVEFNERIENLQGDARSELKRLKSVSSEAWKNIKSRVDAAVDDLKRSYCRMCSHSK